MDYNNVCAVIVTYANRADFVVKVVNSTKKAGIKKFVIVDNNSSKESKHKLRSLIRNNKSIKLISFDKNLGSSGGFKKGLIEAEKMQDVDFIFCLDDDNLVENDIISKLMDFWQSTNNEVLFCLRYYNLDFLKKTNKELDIKRLEKDMLNLNSYCYFSIDKLISMIKNKFVKKVANNKKFYKVPCGAYGGLFMHKSILKKVGYPDSNFWVYFDDIEFTYRMFKAGIPMFLLSDCRIKDLETSVTNADVKSYFNIKPIFENIKNMSNSKRFFGYRNRVYLEKKYLITNKIKYFLNKVIYKIFIRPLAGILYWVIYKNNLALKKIDKAVKAGEVMK